MPVKVAAAQKMLFGLVKSGFAETSLVAMRVICTLEPVTCMMSR